MMAFFETIASRENLPAAMRFARETALGWVDGEAGLLQLDLVVEEIFLNLATHACAGKRVRMGCSATHEEVTLEFRYTGPEFDPRIERQQTLDDTLAERSIGGLGLLLIGEMTSSIEYVHHAGKNQLEVRVPARNLRTRNATQD